jgi:hypothetical protein
VAAAGDAEDADPPPTLGGRPQAAEKSTASMAKTPISRLNILAPLVSDPDAEVTGPHRANSQTAPKRTEQQIQLT